MRKWTEEAKVAQREAIRRWQPWTKSTGPRTETGKRRVASNSCKHATVSIKARNVLRAALKAQRECCKVVVIYGQIQKSEKSEKQTIMLANLIRLFQGFSDDFHAGLLAWNKLQEAEGGVMMPVPERIMVGTLDAPQF